MTFDEYQQESRRTARYPDQGNNYIYPMLGLAGEVGECANKIQKAIRDNGGELSDDVRQELIFEFGDVLWFLAQLATELGVSFDTVATSNLEKLFSRQARGVIVGSGDVR